MSSSERELYLSLCLYRVHYRAIGRSPDYFWGRENGLRRALSYALAQNATQIVYDHFHLTPDTRGLLWRQPRKVFTVLKPHDQDVMKRTAPAPKVTRTLWFGAKKVATILHPSGGAGS